MPGFVPGVVEDVPLFADVEGDELGFDVSGFAVDPDVPVAVPLAVPGRVPHGELLGEALELFGVVVDGCVVLPGIGVPGVVVAGVPLCGVVEFCGVVCGVPADGVAVLAGGVAVLAGGVAGLAGGVAGDPGV